jgi:hypothetical protein
LRLSQPGTLALEFAGMTRLSVVVATLPNTPPVRT